MYVCALSIVFKSELYIAETEKNRTSDFSDFTILLKALYINIAQRIHMCILRILFLF